MKHKNTQNSIYKVQSLERALDILDCFSFQNRELTLSEVVDCTGLNKTTAKRLISNLVNRGYIQHDLQTKRYKLGMRLFELGGIVFSSYEGYFPSLGGSYTGAGKEKSITKETIIRCLRWQDTNWSRKYATSEALK